MSRSMILVLALTLAAGCGQQAQVHQGVIECDERTLAFEVAGTVAEMPPAEGQRVVADAVIARLDPTALVLARDEAAAQVALAEGELAAVGAGTRAQDLATAVAAEAAARVAAGTARTERERIAGLHAQGLASDRQRDAAIDQEAAAEAAARAAAERLALLREGPRAEDVAVARARVAVARSALARAAERLARIELRAPLSGIVRHRLIEPGEMAAAGAPVAVLIDPDHPYIDAFVPQGALATLRVGGRATVRVDGRAPVTGAIERIGERLEFTPRYLFGPEDRPDLVARVRVRLDTGEGLHAGVPADVVFQP